MTTNEFERDLNDTSFLKRPGRVDLRVFQNTPDCGDGHPGLQRCFRNYLHEGGMEKDLDLIGYSIKGTSVDINNAEMQQLSNIGANTISPAQWVFVGGADQAVKQADSPTFGGLTINGDITITGKVDGADVSDLKSAFDTHKASTGADHSYIDQSLTITSSPRFPNLNIEDVIQHFGDVDNEIQFGVGTQAFQVAAATTILDLNASGLRIGGANVRVTGIINNDALGTSDVVLCTQGNVKAYADLMLPLGGGEMSGNITMAGAQTVDGVDISDFKSVVEAFLGIGAGNPQYIGGAYESQSHDDFRQSSIGNFVNSEGTVGASLFFGIPIPCDKGSYSVKLDDLILNVLIADTGDYIDQISIIGIDNDDTVDTLYTESTNRTSADVYTYDIGNIDCAGYRKLIIRIATILNDVSDLAFTAPIVKYFYS